MVLTRRQTRTSVFESIINSDILETIAGFVDCKDLVNLSLTCKQLSSSMTEVAVRMINSSGVRSYDKFLKDEDLPALQKLNYLRALLWRLVILRVEQNKQQSVAAATMPTMPDEWF